MYFIQHELNGGEMRVGRHALPVDGVCYETHTVYQFHGCYWHACACTNLKGRHPTRKNLTSTEIAKDTRSKEIYIRSLGWNLIVMRECEWKSYCRENSQAALFKKAFFNRLYGEYRKKETEATILEKVKSNKMYGFIECDIHVPSHMEEYFSDMAPIFKNTLVGREHLGPDMLAFAEANECLKRPQRMLVGSLFGKQILLHSDLLRWYLTHGLVVTKIYQTIHYLPRNVYSDFALSVSDARRRGDTDPRFELVGTTSKLCGNSFYGKTITNKENHRRVVFNDSVAAASSAIASNKFCSLEELNCNVFEIQQFPSEVGYILFFLINLQLSGALWLQK